jgi:hypothetical protein
MKPFSPREDSWKILAVAVLLAGAVIASSLHGAPEPLPGAAMSWSLLFHIERAALLLGAPAAVVFVGWKALRGEFPRTIGGLEYPGQTADEWTSDTLAAHERRIELLETEALDIADDLENDD